jgi:predicted RNA-binding Zn ribbon-like protein
VIDPDIRNEPSSSLDLAARIDLSATLPSGRLCLEFANTADWHASDHPDELLPSYAHLVRWSLKIGLLSSSNAEALLSLATAQPGLAQQIHTWALELREATYRVFAAIAAGLPPTAMDIDLINEALPQAYAQPMLVTHERAFTWHYRTGAGLDQMLWPILRSAAALLVSPDLDRVGQCADDRGCGFLFFDHTRNRSRRWCDMDSCGNRAKARRHYARARSTAAPI